jgi:hypothetical protein
MKKTFALQNPPHKPPRVIEGIKSEVRKYLKRERRKPLPEEVDFWDFDCRTGQDESTAREIHVSELTGAIDTAAQENWSTVYIEILAKAAHRNPEPKKNTIPGPEASPAN